MAESDRGAIVTRYKFTTPDGRDGIEAIADWLRQPCDPAEVAARTITRPEGEPWPDCPSYLWNNARQCYILREAKL